jgi:alcohol dehydrogenase
MMMHITLSSAATQPKQLITHRVALRDVMQAYSTFGNAMKERDLKVIVTNDDWWGHLLSHARHYNGSA